MLAWLDEASGIREFGAICGERVRRHFIDARFVRSYGDSHILLGIQRYMLVVLLIALVWVRTIEIERKRIEKLELLVILE
jgi:hypothetical protein